MFAGLLVILWIIPMQVAQVFHAMLRSKVRQNILATRISQSLNQFLTKSTNGSNNPQFGAMLGGRGCSRIVGVSNIGQLYESFTVDLLDSHEALKRNNPQNDSAECFSPLEPRRSANQANSGLFPARRGRLMGALS